MSQFYLDIYKEEHKKISLEMTALSFLFRYCKMSFKEMNTLINYYSAKLIICEETLVSEQEKIDQMTADRAWVKEQNEARGYFTKTLK